MDSFPILPSGEPLGFIRSLVTKQRELLGTIERLATGDRLVRASNGPAALIASERLRGVLAQLDAEVRVLQRADSRVAVADGALGEVSNLMIEAEAIAVESAGATSDAEREAYQLQLDSIMNSIDFISTTTTFGGEPLLDGTAVVSAAGQDLAIDRVATDALGDDAGNTLADLRTGGSLSLASGDLETTMEVLGAARSSVTTLRGELGAFSKYTVGSRLNVVGVTIEQMAAADAKIRGVDYAQESANLIRLQIQTEAMIKFNANRANTLFLLS